MSKVKTFFLGLVATAMMFTAKAQSALTSRVDTMQDLTTAMNKLVYGDESKVIDSTLKTIADGKQVPADQLIRAYEANLQNIETSYIIKYGTDTTPTTNMNVNVHAAIQTGTSKVNKLVGKILTTQWMIQAFAKGQKPLTGDQNNTLTALNIHSYKAFETDINPNGLPKDIADVKKTYANVKTTGLYTKEAQLRADLALKANTKMSSSPDYKRMAAGNSN